MTCTTYHHIIMYHIYHITIGFGMIDTLYVFVDTVDGGKAAPVGRWFMFIPQ